MQIVSSGEFRNHQKSYFDRARQGEEIIVQQGKKYSYRIVPVVEDDTLMTKEEFFAKIDHSLSQYNEGKYISFDTNEELFTFLENL